MEVNETWRQLYLTWSIFILMSCVAHSTCCCMKNRNCLTVENNLLVHRHLCQNAVPSDVVWDSSDFRLRKKMRKFTVLPAVAYCSLVERHHYRWAYCLYLLNWWKQRFLWKFGARLPDCTASQEDSNAKENIASIKKREDPLHDNMFFTRDSNKGVCHVTLQCAGYAAWSTNASFCG